MLNPLPPPPKKMLLSAVMLNMLHMLSVLELPPPPKKKKKNYSNSMWVNSVIVWVSGGRAKPKNVSFSCHVEYVEYVDPPPLQKCAAFCWICWICWIILELTTPPPHPKKKQKGPLIVPKTFNIFNMTAERSIFFKRGIQHDSTYSTWQLKEALFRRDTPKFQKNVRNCHFTPPPPPKNVLIVPKTFNILNIFNMTVERSIF